MQDYIQTFLHPDKKIEMFADPEYSDIRYWQCDGQIIPCGGTHLDSTRFIKTIALKRKSPGKGKERILCSATWTNALFESYNL